MGGGSLTTYGSAEYSNHTWVINGLGNSKCMYCGLDYVPGSFIPYCPGYGNSAGLGQYGNQYNSLGQLAPYFTIEPEVQKMMTKEQLQKNKFYLGTANPTGHATLEEAIEQAKAVLSADKTKTEQTIVQIVKVVRKELPPVTVVDVE